MALEAVLELERFMHLHHFGVFAVADRAGGSGSMEEQEHHRENEQNC
jgi:hypothetical protein